MRIAIVGTGYVGLVSGACFSDFGHDVTCVDADAAKIEALRRGETPIFEPGLEAIVAANVSEGRLTFATDLAEAVRGAAAVFIAVGTPSRRGDGHADLTHVFAAARSVAAAIDGFTVIATKSTTPVGTGDEIERIVRAVRPDADFAVVSNPEFMREGAAIRDFKLPDRIVIGVHDERAKQVMSDIYRPLHLNQGPLMFTSRRAAELIKYAANAFLAMKVAYINEVADLCEEVGVNVQEVARGVGLDNRIGTKFLNAGPGFGGSCFPKDARALIQTASEAGAPMRIVETVVAVNEDRKSRMVDKVMRACGGSVAGRRVAILGLTFKAGTDDLRDAPSLVLIPALQRAGATIVAFDPQGMRQAEPLLPGAVMAKSAYDCIEGADALVILTEWEAFRALDLSRVRRLLRSPVVVDLRNIYRPQEMAALGFTYESVGRGDAAANLRHGPKSA